MIIGVDVDETIVEVMPAWLEYLNRVAGTNRTMRGCLYDYNLGCHFPELKSLNIDPMSFWDSDYLYQTLRPTLGCVKAIRKLYENGHKIIFISHTRKMHHGSKVKFLKQHFPFIPLGDITSGHAFIATHEKGVMSQINVMIDDRLKYLPLFGKDVLKIQFKTPYTQDYNGEVSLDMVSNNWSAIEDFVADLS